LLGGGHGDESDDEDGGELLSLNDATFEQLRDVGLSVTQTGRVLAHRERSGHFESIDELEGIPGFPRDFLDQIKPRLTV
jgi:DNA uptake protein ComE-like DNA-binding protein